MGFGALRSIIRPVFRRALIWTRPVSAFNSPATTISPVPELRHLFRLNRVPWIPPSSSAAFHSLTDTRLPKRRPSDKPKRKRASLRPPGPYAWIKYTPGEPVSPNNRYEGRVKRRNEKKRIGQRKAFILQVDGLNVKFWKDRWIGNELLKDSYPHIFLIASDKDSSIAQNREDNTWRPLLRRNLNDWEINELIALLATLEVFIFTDQEPDRILWGSSKEKNFTVKEGYNVLCSHNSVLEDWPWKYVWRTKMPLKVSCFTWTALKEAALTQDNLCKRKISLVNRCYLCHQSLESVNHLLLHCPVTSDIWNLFLSIFGLSWNLPRTIKEAYTSWIFWRVDKTIKKVWEMIPAVIFWVVWNERNRRCFDGLSTPTHSLKAKCLVFLFSWNFLTPVNSIDSFLDFVSSMVLV